MDVPNIPVAWRMLHARALQLHLVTLHSTLQSRYMLIATCRLPERRGGELGGTARQRGWPEEPISEEKER